MKKQDNKILINTSSISNRITKSKSPEIISHIKYNELYEKFVKLFKSKGYVQSDSFDKKIWFLKEDVVFQQIINKTSMNNSKLNMSMTPTPNMEKNRVHEILSEINENYDFSNLLVSVENFIYKIVETLIIATNTIERSNRTIESFQATKRNQIIKESIRLLELKIEKMPSSTNFQSKMQTKIIKAINFPPGKYEFSMKYFEIKENNMQQTNLALNNEDSRITLSVNGDIVENRFNQNDFDFIVFSQLDYEESHLKFKSSTNSGSTFSNFSISSKELESKKAYLLDIMLNTIDNILDISKIYFKENLELNMNPGISRNNPNLNNTLQKSIILECSFEFDPMTRISILKRISSVFSEVIETKRISESVVDQILDCYFEEISESIRYILTKSYDNSKDACCECLII